MEIQQHDGVVEVAGFQQGFAKRCGRREMCHGREREAPGLRSGCSSFSPLYIGPRERGEVQPLPLPWRKGQGCAFPLSLAPIYSGGEGGHPYLSPWCLPPSRDISSSLVGAWRSPAGLPRSSITTTPLCCCWTESSPTSPSLLAGSRHVRRHRAVRVLNAEVPSIRHLDLR